MASEGSRTALWAVGLSLLAALFFTVTYVLNRAAAVDGGHWAWIAALRYLVTVPLMLPLMPRRGGVAPVLAELRAHPGAWLRWSFVGFVLFYCTLAYAAASGPAWLVAGTFQFTVVAGMLCAPFIYRDARRRVPLAAYGVGALTFAGVLMMQWSHADGRMDIAGWIALVCVLCAAVAYPLGNRMLLLHLEGAGTPLNATQRVFGMSLASLPFWLVVAAWAWSQSGWPSLGQVGLAAGVALSSGIVATILFFKATALVQNNPAALGAVEAMQAAEILFATTLGVLVLGEALPRGLAVAGALLVVAGIVVFARIAARAGVADAREAQALRSERGG